MKFVTSDLAKLMKDLTGNHPMDLEDQDDPVSYQLDAFQDSYLDAIFGDSSRVSFQDWMKKMEERKDVNELWFDPQNLREMVLHKIEV